MASRMSVATDDHPLADLLSVDLRITDGPGRTGLCLPVLDPELPHPLTFIVGDRGETRAIINCFNSVGFAAEGPALRNEDNRLRVVGTGYVTRGMFMIRDLKLKVTDYDPRKRTGWIRCWSAHRRPLVVRLQPAQRRWSITGGPDQFDPASVDLTVPFVVSSSRDGSTGRLFVNLTAVTPHENFTGWSFHGRLAGSGPKTPVSGWYLPSSEQPVGYLQEEAEPTAAHTRRVS